MPDHDELIALERAGWDALSSSAEAAAAFYADVLGDEVLLLLPGGTVIDDRAEAIASMSGVPWASYALSDERVVELTDASAVVAYHAEARRGGDLYRALCSSTYVRRGSSWRLVAHQQSPV